MDSRWYKAIMINNHTRSGYIKGLPVYFRFEQPANIEIATKVLGEEVVKRILRTITVYDGQSMTGFQIDKDEAGQFIKACRDKNNKPISADNQWLVQYNFVARCKCC